MSGQSGGASMLSVVDSNVRDKADVAESACAPWRGQLERNRNAANKALRFQRPVVMPSKPRPVEWMDGRQAEAGTTPGGMYTWYALAALHRFYAEGGDRIKPGRADLEFLALSLHLHHQGRLHRLYTNDRDLKAAASAMAVPVENALTPDEGTPRPADCSRYRRDDWTAPGWIAREAHLRCSLTGFLPLMSGAQSLYSFEVLCEFFALSESERCQRLNDRGVVCADVLDTLEVVRRSFWLGEEKAATAALQLVLNEPEPLQVVAGCLAKRDYEVAANVLIAEANQQWQQAEGDAPTYALAASDALILAAAINRAAVAHRMGAACRIRLHYAENRVGRVRQFLTGSGITFLRGVAGTKGDLSSTPELMEDVRRIELVIGP